MLKFVKNEGVIDAHGVNFFYLGAFFFFFIFIAFGNFPAFSHQRWDTGLDINNDKIYSISDVISWILWIFFMPGDVLIQGLMVSKSVAIFFEVTPNSYGNIGSFLFSVVYWWMVGGKRLIISWLSIIGLIILKNLSGLPLLH